VRTIGPYELTRVLGAGGMGEVWMGRRSALGGAAKTLAIKLLSSSRTHDESARKMFLDEARLSMLLTNANIVQVFDVGEDQGTVYMAMEWVEGLDLAEFTERLRKLGKKLPNELVAYIVGEILKALAYAHDLKHEGVRRTIIHRDISPHNVMLSVTGEVKLMDFGIARMTSEETSGTHVKGKLRYMPPEQLRGSTREPTIDLFAVGAFLHELLDGRKFRSDVDEPRLYGMILDGEVAPLSCPTDVPSALDELRLGLLAPKAADRIPTARAAFRKLSQWQGYRDAKFDLEDLVGSVVEAGTGPLALDLTQSLPANVQHNPARTEVLPSNVELASTQDDHQVVGAGEEQTGSQNNQRTAVTGSLSTLAARGDAAPPPRRRANLLSGSLALIGLGFGVFAVGSVAGWWTDDPEEGIATPVEEAQSEQPVKVEPVKVEPVKVEPVKVEPVKVEPVKVEPVKVESVKVESSPPIEPPPESPSKPTLIKVPVTLKADPKLNNFWVEVKLGGKVHEIKKPSTGSASSKLKPGDYSVQYRTEVDGSWKDAGRVKIPSEGKATVFVQADGKAVVKQ
jgi:serine/threonine protein kinase